MNRLSLAPVLGALVALAAVALPGPAAGGAPSATSPPREPPLSAPPAPRAEDGHASRARDAIIAMDYEAARSALSLADPSSPTASLVKAMLALYEEECDLAVAILSDPKAAESDEGRALADVARGCARVTAATVVERDEGKGVIVRYHDDADRALQPLLVDTVVKTRESLARDLGVTMPVPTRITVVRDHLALSAMTGLPYKAAQTTGTVAIAKWGRVTMLSPRASKHGYSYRDTLAHELTHLAISLQSRERAPLWLHEGVARRQEVRWREPGPFDEKPSVESVVLKGIELKLDLPLDRLGPSIAMLPSADAAVVAFAEVTSFVKYFVESSGDGALGRLLMALRAAPSVDDALREVSGETLSQWDVRWRAQLTKRAREPLSPLFGLGATLPGGRDTRDRVRLAELLLGRGHAAAALREVDDVPEVMLGDPSVRYIRARALEANGDREQAAALLEDPNAWVATFGPCWSVRGRLARARGDGAAADASFAQAVSQDPFSIEASCERRPGGSVGAEADPSPPGTPLCDAAMRWSVPDVGRD